MALNCFSKIVFVYLITTHILCIQNIDSLGLKKFKNYVSLIECMYTRLSYK